MSLARRALLALSTNTWLHERAIHSPLVRRSVSRFMPGERFEDALAAARTEHEQHGIAAIVTHLGENLTRPEQADHVASHYLEILERIHASGLDVHVSVKPTQLGLDFDRDRCLTHLLTLVDRADALQQFIWIDMESSAYVDRSLDLLRLAVQRSRRVGIAIQAYLRRTPDDLDRLLTYAPAIRLVKGAYLEPASVAYPRKADVDDSYYQLGVRLLTAAASGHLLAHIATHDGRLVERLAAFASTAGVPASTHEYAMLYGIQRPLQRRLAKEGKRVRVLIAYGDNWFPWYMRRLAERPANVWFIVKNLGGRS